MLETRQFLYNVKAVELYNSQDTTFKLKLLELTLISNDFKIQNKTLTVPLI